jgi:serine/threonine-protein kinase HipA
MHLKNFSCITQDKKVTLSPVYDLLNSTISLTTKEEIALPLNGKKNNLTKNDFFIYFAKERLNLNPIIIEEIKREFQEAIPQWKSLIECSFLSQPMKKKYLALFEERCKRIGF